MSTVHIYIHVGLPKNFKLERIIEILSPGEREELNRSQKKRTFRCLTHTKKSADYFCTTCDRLACGDCLLEEHLNHEGVKRATEVLAEHVLALKGLIPGARESLKTGETSLVSVDGLAQSVQQEGEEAVRGVKIYFAKIREILASRESDIEREIVEQVETSRTKIERSRLALRTSLQDFSECSQELEALTEREGFEVLVEEERLKSQLNSSREQLEMCCGEISKLKAGRIKVASLKDARLEVLCRTLGAKPPTPLPRRRQEKPVTTAPLSSGAISRMNSTDADYALTPDVSRIREAANDDIADDGNRSDVVADGDQLQLPKPPMRNESHRSSPDIFKPSLVWGTQNMSSSFFQSATGSVYPRGVCCGISGTVLVTDVQNHCVRILASTGRCLDVIGREGKNDGMFGEPTSVSADQEGNILVCDLCPARLQKFTPEGQQL